MGFLTFLTGILPVVKKIAKPISNAINGVIQSLDEGGIQRNSRYINYMRYGGNGSMITNQGIGASRYSSLGPDNNIRVLDEAPEEERDAINASFAIEQVRNMNLLLHEIPFLTDDDYQVQLRQSIKISIPSGLSLVLRIFANPLMNFGGQLVNLSQQYRVMRLDTISIQLERQNEVYSTVKLSYNPVITSNDRKEMINDLEEFYVNENYKPIASKSHYFYSNPDQKEGDEVINGVDYHVLTFSDYMHLKNRIDTLPFTRNVADLPDNTLGIDQPGMTFCPMRNDLGINPVYHSGLEYVGLSYASNYISLNGHLKREDALYQMPTYGTFYYTISNDFDKTVDQIITFIAHITCKQHIDSSTYVDPDHDPIL